MTGGVNLDDARRFLDLIAFAGGPQLFQTFSDTGRREGQARTFRGTLPELAERLEGLNQHGAGVFLTINRVDGDRRKAAYVTQVRALFVDHDQANHERDFAGYGLEPSLIVESSPGKHHVYWLIEPLIDELRLDEFADAQARLAAAFDADPKVKDLPRVMRVPGFWHRKGEPFRARIIHESGNRYSADELRDWLAGMAPPEKSPETPSVPAQAALDGVRDRYAESAAERALGALWNAATGERNDTLNTQALGLFGLVKAGRLDGEHVTARLRETASAIGLTGHETEATLRSAWNAAVPRNEKRPEPAPAAMFPNLEREADSGRSLLVPVGEVIRKIRPPAWRVRGYLEAESVAVLFGAPGG